jgi:oxygen-dependent protoporphyrinogen oxidase
MWLDSYDQLKNGMSTLLDAFQRTARLRLGTRVDQLVMERDRIAGLRLIHADGVTEEREYDNVILATPACVTANLVRHVDASLADALSRVKYYPVMVAIAEYQRDIFSPEVRALVFGPQEPLSNAGAYGVTCRNIVRYTFSGRAARAMIEERASPERFIKLGEATLNRYIPVKADERRTFASRLFDPGLCAYGPYHARILEAIDLASRSICNLFITGDYIRGASIEACMRSAKDTVARGVTISLTDARSNPGASTCEPRVSTY